MARLAFTVEQNDNDTPLSPVFGKAPWLLVIDSEAGQISYVRNVSWTSEWICTTALVHAVDVLACAYIDRTALRRLKDAGIDVRLASCSRPATELAAGIAGLPPATEF